MNAGPIALCLRPCSAGVLPEALRYTYDGVRHAMRTFPLAAAAATGFGKADANPHPHHSGLPAELLEGAAVLVARLHQQGVSPSVLLQCSSVADAAAGLAALRSAAEAAAAPLSLTQPGQLPVALRHVGRRV